MAFISCMASQRTNSRTDSAPPIRLTHIRKSCLLLLRASGSQSATFNMSAHSPEHQCGCASALKALWRAIRIDDRIVSNSSVICVRTLEHRICQLWKCAKRTLGCLERNNSGTLLPAPFADASCTLAWLEVARLVQPASPSLP